MSRDIEFVWDLDDDPNGNVQQIAEHDLTIDEVEDVVLNPEATGDVDAVYVVTAYEVDQ
jgi:hypothetical protein